ncbi:transporter substrate-binding domain-containing protein [Roseibium litorale]|uniref:transporter substrate-binding domain-containing protein n=1 Tax=Roseibium litorale TaxID=2803841 RepID=UPI001AD91329
MLPALAEATGPVVPNYWDPKAVLDRPAQVPEKIQFLASDSFPPFVFRDETGRLTGFNVDLARAICLELGSSCSLRIKEFDVLVDALREGEGDAIISGLAPTAELQGSLRFTQDYLKLPARFITLKGKSFDETSLAGKILSVEAGSRHEAFARAFWPEATLITEEDLASARRDVIEGRADAHFGDGLSLSFWLNSEAAGSCCSFAGGPWMEPGYFDQGLSVALRNDDMERAEAIDYALRVLAQKGTFRELYLRYFPLSFY